MVETKDDDGGVESHGARTGEAADAGPGGKAGLEAEFQRWLLAQRPGAAPTEAERGVGLQAEIERLLEGFDDRLAVVNRRLDRILERRA